MVNLLILIYDLVVDDLRIVVLQNQAQLAIFVDLAVCWVDEMKLLIVFSNEEAPSLTINGLVDLAAVHIHHILDWKVAFVAILQEGYLLVVAWHGSVGLGASTGLDLVESNRLKLIRRHALRVNELAVEDVLMRIK